GCMETGKANELVGAGNKSVEEANKLSADAGKKITDLFSQEGLKDFPENRAALKAKVDDVVSVLDKSSANLKSAAEKFEEASKLKIDDKLKDYYTAKAQSYRKLAEINEDTKKQAQMLNDESITDHQELAAKLTPIDEEKNRLQKELKDLEDKA